MGRRGYLREMKDFSSHLSPVVRSFIGEIATTCAANNISFNLSASNNVVTGSGRVSGYFDGGKLVVAGGGEVDHWLGILVHESCHMDQCLEDSRIWREVDPYLEGVDVWLNGGRPRLKESPFKKVVELELDCERRAIRKIKKYRLPLDIELYAQKANAYLFSYEITRRTRKWFAYPYKKEWIFSGMPTKLLPLSSYIKRDHRLLGLFEKNGTERG